MKISAFALALILFMLAIVIIAVIFYKFLRKPGGDRRTANQVAAADVADLGCDLTLSINRLKPHYVNNIMTSIYYLCETEPTKAQSVAKAFSEYLLKILETLKKKGFVPFSWELGLIRNYLLLEKIRLDDRLIIDYDVDITDFEVPPLSVMFLVEYAVKYGVAELDKPGTVKISTRRLAGDKVQISISDNCANTKETSRRNSDEVMNDLMTVKDMIEKDAGGTLTIEEIEGGGSVSTITLKV